MKIGTYCRTNTGMVHRKEICVFPEKELRGLSPNFILMCL
jgi:hypothetical protein